MNSMTRTGRARVLLLGVLLAWGGVSLLARESRAASAAALRSALDSGRAMTETSAVPASQHRSYTGELTEPISGIMQHPHEFLERFAKRKWTRRVVSRECVGCTGQEMTKVSIGAIEDAHKVDFTKLPAYGVIVARLQNLDDKTEAKYGIPGKQVWYALWGGEPATATPLMRFVKVVVRAGKADSLALDPATYPIISCAHRHASLSRRHPDADFKTCALNALSSSRADAWISCSQGCCTSSGDSLGPDRSLRRKQR